MLSPDGRFMSGSTHMPPTGIHWPVGDLVADAGEQLGLALPRSTRTAGPASTRSGSPDRRPSAPPPRRTCGCTCAPSRAIGHSHAVSMWAWPVAMTWWAPARAGTPSASADARPAPATAASSQPPGGWATTSSAPTMAARMRARRGSSSGSVAHHTVEDVEVVQQGLGVGVDDDELGALEPVQRRRCRRSSGEPSGDGRNCTRIGFDAASTTSSTGPGSPGTGTAWRRGWMPCTGRPLRVADEALALEARRVGPEAEVEQRLDASPRPGRRHRHP